MKVILLKDGAGKNGAVCLSGARLIWSGFGVLVLFPILLAVSAYCLTAAIDRIANPFVDPQYRIAVESRVAEQQMEVQNTKHYVRQHLDVLGRRVGSLQAQVSRINAVEMRIAERAGIDLSDFQFGQDPPVGGAESGKEPIKQVDIENAIFAIEQELSIRESEISAVDFMLAHNNLKSQQTPSGWPVKGGWVSSKFGSRMHPMTGKKQFHRGVDIPGKPGAKVLAVASGVVTRSERNGNYGWLIEIDHGDDYTTLYSHNRKNLVNIGETVTKGQAIAEIGSTGLSTGPHVHFEVLKGKRVINPVKYLYKKA